MSEDVTFEQVKKIVISGISKYAMQSKISAGTVQIVFKISKEGDLQFIACIDNIPKNSLPLDYLIGKNVYNFVVKTKIRKLLRKYASDNNCETWQINMLTFIKSDDAISIFIRNEGTIIREVTDYNELK